MEYIEITNKQFYEGLKTKRNMLVLGKSGWGKTATVEQYARDHKLRIAYVDMAGQLPESIAGIPAVYTTAPVKEILMELSKKLKDLALEDKEDTKEFFETFKEMERLSKEDMDGQYYKRMLDIELKEFLECEGEGWVLFFDEINQGNPDALNTLYGITHPDPTMRRWCGHRISKCQIVACGNLADGTDGTVYLTDLPTPLLNRFFVFKLKLSKKDATDYLKKKYKNIPQVAKYIKEMLDNDIAPRDVDLALDVLQFNHDGMFLEAKLGTVLAAKILDLQKGITSLDPAQLIKNAKEVYAQFKDKGYITFGVESITTEEALVDKFKEYLNDEEIAAVLKGDE